MVHQKVISSVGERKQSKGSAGERVRVSVGFMQNIIFEQRV